MVPPGCKQKGQDERTRRTLRGTLISHDAIECGQTLSGHCVRQSDLNLQAKR